jgi:O-acetyl-ADP-ribose deacetylase (regulator of RNase III)
VATIEAGIQEATQSMTGITYVRGDATCPPGPGAKIICHVCNDVGAWGAGFVLALSARWPDLRDEYRGWYAARDGFRLGAVQFVPVEPYIWVANMVGQRGTKAGSKGPPIRYEALTVGLAVVGQHAVAERATVHMPRIGCGLAGGKWELVEPLIAEHLSEKGVAVTVYDFGG